MREISKPPKLLKPKQFEIKKAIDARMIKKSVYDVYNKGRVLCSN